MNCSNCNNDVPGVALMDEGPICRDCYVEEYVDDSGYWTHG